MELHVEQRGAGPRIVFTHGYADTSATWSAQVTAFSRHFTTVVWDLPSHGRSDPADDGRYDRRMAIAALARVVDDAPSVLVGHSFGGYLSLLFALTEPHLVRALVLVATGPGYRDVSAREDWNAFTAKHGPRMGPSDAAWRMVLQEDSAVIDGLRDIAVPVLHLVGDQDDRFHSGHAYLQRTLPDARGVTLPGGRHDLQRDEADAVNAEIGAFLAAIS